MSVALIVLPEAEEELTAALTWYESRRSGLGLEFLGAVEAILGRVRENPDAFESWEGSSRYRRAPRSRFPFVIVYDRRPEAIEVVAVAHTRREPGYWRAR